MNPGFRILFLANDPRKVTIPCWYGAIWYSARLRTTSTMTTIRIARK